MNVIGRTTSSYSNISDSRQQMRQKLRDMTVTSKTNTEEKKTFTGTSVAKTISAGYQVYSEQIRAQRQKRTDAALSVKKIKYQFKDISSKIIRSKTSAAARQVASQAKREYMRLKRQQGNSSEDDEELAAAIAHAKAMERVARKKVKHLEEEEMAKTSGGPCAGDAIDKELEEDSVDDAEDVDEGEWSEAEDEYADSEYEGLADYYVSDELDFEIPDFDVISDYDDLSNILASTEILMSDMGELTDDMLEEVSDSMKEVLEDLGFEEISDFAEAAKKDMDPADLKAMKIKHRNKEMKDIVKADSEYLKAIFKHYQEIKSGTATSTSSTGADTQNVGVASYAAEGASPMSFDVSI